MSSIPLDLHFLRSLFVQCHRVRSNSLREQVPFSPALARFSSPLELFPDRRAAIARMYVFICEAKLIACLPCGCPIFCANLLPCLWIYHASNPYSQNDTRTLSRPISQHPSSNRHGGGCCEALGYIYIYIYICIYIHTRIYIYIHTCIYIYMYINIINHISMFIDIWLYKYTHIWTQLCVNINIYIYIYI